MTVLGGTHGAFTPVIARPCRKNENGIRGTKYVKMRRKRLQVPHADPREHFQQTGGGGSPQLTQSLMTQIPEVPSGGQDGSSLDSAPRPSGCRSEERETASRLEQKT